MLDPHVILVADLAFGDCGKGTVVDFLARATGARTVVRFNGGPQAAHNVITPDGRHHTFAQFGSATFCRDVRTVLSRFMLIEPYALLNEAAHLARVGVPDALGRLLIDARCPVITPAHQAANRLVEFSRGDAAHGTCGMGIGQTMQDLIDHPALMLRAAELRDRPAVAKKLRRIRDLKVDQLRDVLASAAAHPKARHSAMTLSDPSWIDAAVDNYAEVARHSRIGHEAEMAEALRTPGMVIFEGAQGVLLDESFGFHPHTTWSTTTFANAHALLSETAHAGRVTRVGVLRSYFTRHGSGPLVTEDPTLLSRLREPHNDADGWAGRFRVGPFDAVAARYALAVAGGVDLLAMTHVDRIADLPRRLCTAYREKAPSFDSASADIDGFVRRDGTIVDIVAARPANLALAEERTNQLRQFQPIYTPVPGPDDATFLSFVGSALGTPVGLISRGPAVEGKQFLNGFGVLGIAKK